jgi:hypothetical protein|tara:strand:+ start:446 stop:1030 length:585 start_codon:yes stop_codon:yes gene_type:complete
MPCGFCHQTGHNRTTCSTFRAVRERDGHQRNVIQIMDSQRETMIEQLEQERNENINTIDLTRPHLGPDRPLDTDSHQTPPDTPRLMLTPPPANYLTPDAPRMGRRGRRGGEWNIQPMMEHLFNDDDEIYTPKKKQLVTCVECPCETTSCAICMDDLTQVDLMVTRCGHQFHSGCMITHLRKKDDCPLCRGILVA